MIESSSHTNRAEAEYGYLFDEYKLLQDKIDKIGAFRVTIKGWSVTATVAALAAITTGKGFSPSMTAVALTVLLAWFFWFERDQVDLGWKFNGRARIIEIQIEKRERALGKRVTFSSPNIARSLFGGKRRSDLVAGEFANKKLERIRIWVNEQYRLAYKSDLIFYITLILATWAIVGISKPSQETPSSVVQNTVNVQPQPCPKVEIVEQPSASTPVKNVKRDKKK